MPVYLSDASNLIESCAVGTVFDSLARLVGDGTAGSRIEVLAEIGRSRFGPIERTRGAATLLPRLEIVPDEGRPKLSIVDRCLFPIVEGEIVL